METKQRLSPGISCIIESWREGQRPDARGVLQAHPELSDRSVILDLALEEYCLRRDAGEDIPCSTFCEQFPTVRAELRMLLEVEQHLPSEEDCWPELGETFLEFHLLAQLGAGAAARVYLARQKTLGHRYVALKVSRGGASEAATLGKLQHPHVVPVFSVHHDSAALLTAVCMPYLGAVTLHDVCRAAFEHGVPQRADVILTAANDCLQVGEFVRGEAEASELLRTGSYIEGMIHVAAELADGLAYTHGQGVLHRDLKPSNVLITPQGRPMLLDFNLCWDRDIERTRVGGTLPYMPPEQVYVTFFDDAADMMDEPRSDIYSLGVILFQLLTNRLPFPAVNPAHSDEVRRHLAAKERGAVDVRRWNPQVPARLAALISECLAAELDRRPASAAELAGRLRALLPSRPAAAPAPMRRRAAARWITVSGAVLLAAGSLAAFQNHSSAPPVEAASSRPSSGDDGAAAEAPTVESLLREAKQLCDERRFSEAEDRLHSARQLRPGPWVDEYLACCAFLRDDFEAAAEHLRECINSSSDDVNLLNNLGCCWLKRGDFSKAKLLLNSALTIDPKHAHALLNRALCNLGPERDSDGGISYIESLLELSDQGSLAIHFQASRIIAGAIQRDGDAERLIPILESELRKCFALGISSQEVSTQFVTELFGNEPWYIDAVSSAPNEIPDRMDFWRAQYVAPDTW